MICPDSLEAWVNLIHPVGLPLFRNLPGLVGAFSFLYTLLVQQFSNYVAITAEKGGFVLMQYFHFLKSKPSNIRYIDQPCIYHSLLQLKSEYTTPSHLLPWAWCSLCQVWPCVLASLTRQLHMFVILYMLHVYFCALLLFTEPLVSTLIHVATLSLV